MSKHNPQNKEEAFAYQFHDDVHKLIGLSSNKKEFVNFLSILKTHIASYEAGMENPNKKCYFVTYTGQHRQISGITTIWNDVIDESPMEFIANLNNAENESLSKGNTSYYSDFYILNAIEISRTDFINWKGKY